MDIVSSSKRKLFHMVNFKKLIEDGIAANLANKPKFNIL